MINFRKAIDDHEDGIIPFLSLWKAGDEIHTDLVPFPLRNSQGLMSASRPLMLYLNAMTKVAVSDELSDFSLHPGPPEPLA